MLHPAPEFLSDCAFSERASLHYTGDFQTMRAILRLALYVSLLKNLDPDVIKNL